MKMKRLFFLLLLSIYWTLAAAQEPLPGGAAGARQEVTLARSDAACASEYPAAACPSECPAAVRASETPSVTADAASQRADYSFADTLSAAGDPSGAAGVPATRMTLNDCMAYAVEHSPAVRQQDYANRNYRQDYIESVASLVPSLGGTVGASTSFGRSVDPETNTYTDVSNLSNNYSVSGEMPLFAGLTGINTIRAAKVMRLLGVEELQRAKDDVALKTMQAYFDVVYYTGSVRLAREQLETSTANLAKSRKLLELGMKSEADVAEVEAQAAADDYLLTQQENNLELAKISLSEVMNYPAERSLEVDTEVAIETPAGAAPFSDVLSYALDNNPTARRAAYDVRQSRLRYAVARGGLYPSVYVGGGYSTNFFMSLDDHSQYPSFKNQFRDNRGYYFSAQLNIPIFGGLSRRTRVNRARNNWHITEQRRDQTLRALESEIAQNYQQMLGFGKEFVQASKKSAAAELAYKAVAGKYERGMVSALDLQTAANNMLQARSERLRARLQYVIKTRLVEYYNGAPLIR